jgi:hypothetical protein
MCYSHNTFLRVTQKYGNSIIYSVYTGLPHLWKQYSVYTVHETKVYNSRVFALSVYPAYSCREFSPSTWACVLQILPYFTFLLFGFACAPSYNIAVCDVSAGCLTGSDDLHHLSSSETIVPCNRICNLYSWKLFGPLHFQQVRRCYIVRRVWVLLSAYWNADAITWTEVIQWMGSSTLSAGRLPSKYIGANCRETGSLSLSLSDLRMTLIVSRYELLSTALTQHKAGISTWIVKATNNDYWN